MAGKHVNIFHTVESRVRYERLKQRMVILVYCWFINALNLLHLEPVKWMCETEKSVNSIVVSFLGSFCLP